MKNIKLFLLILFIWSISWLISAILLIPCLFISLFVGFKRDFHFEFHLWWTKKVLAPLYFRIF